jgi:membrane protease YdiL (CAAX protease family)
VTKPETSAYGRAPCYPELIAIVAAGAGHVALELSVSATVARVYNVIVPVAAIAYLVWRFRRTEGVARVWGMRLDNFGRALSAHAAFGVAGAIVLLVYGAFAGTARLPATFWLTLGLYPVWGIAQQFALQNLIARNLTDLAQGPVTGPAVTALVAATLFAASHYPRIELVVLTFAAGIVFTLIYRRLPNLWAVGIVHGLLGSLAYYVVLGEDPGAVIVRFLSGQPP